MYFEIFLFICNFTKFYKVYILLRKIASLPLNHCRKLNKFAVISPEILSLFKTSKKCSGLPAPPLIEPGY